MRIAGERHGEKIDLSLRTSKVFIDLNAILREITPVLGGSGGGHPSAAGARIPGNNFFKLIKLFNEKIS